MAGQKPGSWEEYGSTNGFFGAPGMAAERQRKKEDRCLNCPSNKSRLHGLILIIFYLYSTVITIRVQEHFLIKLKSSRLLF